MESVLLTIPRGLRIGQTVASRNVSWRRNMISKTAIFIPRQNEEGLISRRRMSHGLIDALDEDLVHINGGWRMH